MSALTEEDRQEQRDELELLEAMRATMEEFFWEERGGIFEGEIRASVELDQPVSVRLAVSSSKASAAAGKNPALNRQQSQSAFVAHLPPLCLHFHLPTDYPSSSPPTFTLASSWLNFSQLTIICRELDKMWCGNQGSVVLYLWQQFLAKGVFSLLGVTTELILEPQNIQRVLTDVDQRAVQEVEHPLLVIPLLTDFDRKQAARQFRDQRFCCEICLQSVLGARCEKLHPCGHTHCADCLSAHIRCKIESGSVSKIDCPSAECTELIAPPMVQHLVPADLFSRYDKLLLQQTLEGMEDIVYCPRPTCRCVTVKEEGEDMAVCPGCTFAFCILCKRTWHGVSPCKLLPDDVKQLKEVYDASSSEIQQSMEQRYGRPHLLRAFQEVETESWITTNSKQCPKCHAHIQRSYGCNKMYCSHCSSHFCWLCGVPLPHQNPYSHYHLGASSCAGKLFDGIQDVEDDELWY